MLLLGVPLPVEISIVSESVQVPSRDRDTAAVYRKDSYALPNILVRVLLGTETETEYEKSLPFVQQ